MAHMKCVCFLHPSEESLEALEAELKEPKYGEYYLCQFASFLVIFRRDTVADVRMVNPQILATF